jgi:hypothetical protein
MEGRMMRTMTEEYLYRVRQIAIAQCRAEVARVAMRTIRERPPLLKAA